MHDEGQPEGGPSEQTALRPLRLSGIVRGALSGSGLTGLAVNRCGRLSADDIMSIKVMRLSGVWGIFHSVLTGEACGI